MWIYIFTLFALTKAATIVTNYSEEGNSSGNCIIATSDNGYLIVGIIYYGFPANDHFYLLKINGVGEISWSANYTEGNSIKGISAMETRSKNKFIVAGSILYGLGYLGVILMQYDTSGILLSADTYSYYQNTMAAFVMEDNDSGLDVVGYLRGNGLQYQSMYLFKIGNQSNTELNVTFRIGYYDSPEWGAVVSDGYVIAGYSANTTYDIMTALLVKLNFDGEVVWSQYYGGGSESYFYYGAATMDGGFALVGYSTNITGRNNDAYLVKTDQSGNIEWNKTYGGTGNNKAFSIIQTNDGGYAFVGTTTSFSDDIGDIYFVKTFSNGTQDYQMTFGQVDQLDAGSSLTQNSQGDIAITGTILEIYSGIRFLYFIRIYPCPQGTYEFNNTCIDCPAGTYNNYRGKTSISDCINSPPGYYSSAGANEPTACPLGSYNNVSGSINCLKCPAGTYNNLTGRSSFADCIFCPLGYYSEAGVTLCIACPIGTYTDQNGSAKCLNCPPGTYNNLIGKFSIKDCKLCPIGYYSSSSGAIGCTACPLGTYTETSGSLNCLKCPPGTYGSSGMETAPTSSCILCPSGTVNSKEGAISISACTSCPIGYNASWNRDYCMYMACHIFCEDCYGLTNTECYSCNKSIPSLTLSNNACICNIGYYQTTINGELTCARNDIPLNKYSLYHISSN